MAKSNALLIDCPVDRNWDFLSQLEETTGRQYDIWYKRANRSASTARRMAAYVQMPVKVFANRRRLDSIVAWQQFYGLCFAALCRLFKVKKSFSLVVMTFIYKPKSGIAGKIYERFMRYVVRSGYIDRLVVCSKGETELYARTFDVPESLFRFVRFSKDVPVNQPADAALADRSYICSPGSSHRDYGFLVGALKDTDYNVDIVCDTCNVDVDGEQIRVHRDTFGDDYLRLLANAWCVVLPLSDSNVSAGQIVALQAMAMGKPVIATYSEGLRDYITHGYNGILIENDPDKLVEALEMLKNDSELYSKLATNGLKRYKEEFSERRLGRDIGEIVNEVARQDSLHRK